MVVQSDLFNGTHASVVSQVMVDKTIAIPRGKITGRVGALAKAQMNEVEEALRLWLGLGG